MSCGLTTLCSSPSGFLPPMVLFQKLVEQPPLFRHPLGIPGQNYDSGSSVHKKPYTFPH